VKGEPLDASQDGHANCFIYACKASVDMFRLTKEDFILRVKGIITIASSTGTPRAARSSSPVDACV
jgi:peroxiredoxin family protein